jgi:hypothetical protein
LIFVILTLGFVTTTPLQRRNFTSPQNQRKMENDKVIQSIKNLFAGADERNWPKVQSVMAKTVLLDYTSMTGGSPSTQTPEQITDAWAAFLPGFDKTHHQLSGFKTKLNGNIAHVHYTGKADHVIGNEVWTVEGNYDTDLQKENSNWLVTKHKFNFARQSGNTNLPAMATKIIQQ